MLILLVTSGTMRSCFKFLICANRRIGQLDQNLFIGSLNANLNTIYLWWLESSLGATVDKTAVAGTHLAVDSEIKTRIGNKEN